MESGDNLGMEVVVHGKVDVLHNDNLGRALPGTNHAKKNRA